MFVWLAFKLAAVALLTVASSSDNEYFHQTPMPDADYGDVNQENAQWQYCPKF